MSSIKVNYRFVTPQVVVEQRLAAVIGNTGNAAIAFYTGGWQNQ